MSALTEGRHTGEFLISEANGERSRENVVALSGQTFKAGQVLGKIAVATASAAAFAGNTGNGVMGAITVSQGAMAGVYKLLVIEPGANVGTFEVEGPNGVIIGRGVVATAFSAGGLAFTLADGATDFVAGDGFNITVAAGSGKYRVIDFTSAVGADIPAGISWDNVDASVADKVCAIIARSAEVQSVELEWPAGATTNQKAVALAQLAASNMIYGR